MYNKFFGFKEKPFKLVPNPEYLFLSKSHEEALGHLTYAISHGDGFVEITGEVGTGKTTLCRVFLENLDESVEAAYIFNPKLDALQLLKVINDEFGIDSTPDNTKDLIDILNEFLIEKKAAGKKVLVLIDEAQNLSHEVLEQLRLLSNLETTQEKLLQVILVGQPELGDLLSSHQLRQLGQRITINCQLEPLTFKETVEYIRHRISLASHRAGPPFDKASYRAIYKYSKGVPRLINIACGRALLNAFSRSSFNVTGAITKEAIKELTRKDSERSDGWLQGAPGLVVLAAILVPLFITMFYFANEQKLGPAIINDPAPKQIDQAEVQQTPTEEEPALSPTEQPGVPAVSQMGAPVSIHENSHLLKSGDEPAQSADDKDSLAADLVERPLEDETKTVEPQSQADVQSQNFLSYLKGLKSRFSRNNSMEQILKLWFPEENIVTRHSGIDTARIFFHEEANQHNLEMQPVATESGLKIFESLNVPVIFTFYITGHTWPKYIAVTGIDENKIFFINAEQNVTAFAEKEDFLRYWSGEAFIFWKNFKDLRGTISQRSKGKDIKVLKQFLQQLGYNHIPATEEYDQETEQVIKDIQNKYGLHVDGLVGSLTKISLYNEDNKLVMPSLAQLDSAEITEE
jgi:general secretion pathway protein A